MTGIGYPHLLRSLPGLFLVLRPDERFTIADASDAYLGATGTEREQVAGRSLFEVLPESHPGVQEADGAAGLRASLERVLATRAPDAMPARK